MKFLSSAEQEPDITASLLLPGKRIACNQQPVTTLSEIDGATDRAMASVMETSGVAQAYGRWAPVYDLMFGAVFSRGRRAAVIEAERIGGRILEAGVGTGLSLAEYSAQNEVIGIDISAPMLEKARRRVARRRLMHVRELAVMDAENLTFPDSSFDVVVAQYVVTAVPNPERALDEFVRVLRPDGEIVITSRIGADTGFRSIVENRLMPITSRLGWRTEFPWDRYLRWAATSPSTRLIERRPLPPFGHFSLIRFAKLPDNTASVASQPGGI
ncbi:MAG: methyltransferase domain-containing protein [Acetobacteraceae bacterium]|nr:methyltransferase domain-containing protein [Acetobacteraceae bacterium]